MIASLATSLQSRMKFPTEISGKLQLQLTRAEKKQLTKRHTENAEAYRLYLKGRHHWNRWTEEGFYKAIEHFQQAVENDPSYALAYAGLADCYVLLGWNSYLPPKEAFPKGKAAAKAALQLDSDLAEAHTPLAALLWLDDWEWKKRRDRIQTQPRTEPHLSHRQPLVRRVHDDHGPTRRSHGQDEEEPGPGSPVAHHQRRSRMGPLLCPPIRRSHRTTSANRRFGSQLPCHLLDSWPAAQKNGLLRTGITEGEKGVKLSGGSPLMRAALAHYSRRGWQDDRRHFRYSMI